MTKSIIRLLSSCEYHEITQCVSGFSRMIFSICAIASWENNDRLCKQSHVKPYSSLSIGDVFSGECVYKDTTGNVIAILQQFEHASKSNR